MLYLKRVDLNQDLGRTIDGNPTLGYDYLKQVLDSTETILFVCPSGGVKTFL